MKHLARLLFLAAALVFILEFGRWAYLSVRGSAPAQETSASESTGEASPREKAARINEHGVKLMIGERAFESSEPGRLFMTDEMDLRIPASWVNDCFDCSVYAAEDSGIRVCKASAAEEEDKVLLAADEYGRVSAEEAARALGFSYTWEEEACTARFERPEKEMLSLPARYDLREEGRVSPVRDQAQWATCWAFAALSAVESSLMPEVSMQFSAEHLSLNHGFSIEDNVGGDFNMALAYLVSWRGPVTEEEDPYGDGYSPEGLEAAVHVQDAVILADPGVEELKKLIYENGAVESAIYARQDLESMLGFYNPDTAAYCYSGEEAVNHDIDIIGWDDDFPKENFAREPEDDGAFLCKNSWGESFGNGGYFYISYYDVNIGKYGVSYTGVESADNYDHIYQCDELGWTGAVGYGNPDALFAAVYTAGSEEELAAAGFYSTEPGTWYDLYLVHDFAEAADLAETEYLRSGCLLDRGYYTVDLPEGIRLEEGERFAVVVRIRTTDSTHPVAIEYAGSEYTNTAKTDDGETYMSPEGRRWTRVEEAAEGNVCLKVYTREN